MDFTDSEMVAWANASIDRVRELEWKLSLVTGALRTLRDELDERGFPATVQELDRLLDSMP